MLWFQYVRTPMTCWAPVHFTRSHIKFTNDYCWVKNTYYLPWNDQVPRDGAFDQRQMIPYYQWMPFILLAQVWKVVFWSQWYTYTKLTSLSVAHFRAANSKQRLAIYELPNCRIISSTSFSSAYCIKVTFQWPWLLSEGLRLNVCRLLKIWASRTLHIKTNFDWLYAANPALSSIVFEHPYFNI